MPTAVALSHMVDLALGTPEVGAVNFNVLHSLLHALIHKLNLGDAKADINEEDKEFLSSKQVDSATSVVAESGIGSEITESSIPQKRSNYHSLEDKVAKLEQQLNMLNSLPSNEDLFDRTKTKGDGEKPRPVAEMWQNMQLQKRVDANEEGISKLMSIVEDMMSEMQGIKEMQEDMNKRLDELSGLKDLEDRLKQLEELTNDLNNRLSMYPSIEIFNDFVTWTALEDALKGLREALQPPERIVIEMQTQTQTPVQSRPTSAHPSTRPSSARTTPGPSAELMEILERIGRLSDMHDKLDIRVGKVEEELKNKADKDSIPTGSTDVPEDLLAQLKDMQDKLNALQKSRDKPSNTQPSNTQPASNNQTNVDNSHVTSQIDDLSEQMRALADELRNKMGQIKNELGDLEKYLMNQIKGLPSTDYGDDIIKIHKKLDDLEAKLISVEELALDTPSVIYMETQPDEPDEDDTMVDTKADEANKKEEASNKPVDSKVPETNKSPIETKEPKVCPASEQSGDKPAVTQSVRRVSIDPTAAELDLQKKMKWLMQDTNREITVLKDSLSDLEEQLRHLAAKVDEKDVPVPEAGDSEALTRMQQVLLQLQAELDRLANTASQLLDENTNKSKQIEELYGMCGGLDDKKADKEFVHMEVDVKADKRHLDGKVNRSLFDTTTDELNKMIQDLLNKLSGHESEWKKALGFLSEDVDGKLDRLEFGPIREDLERQLRSLLKKISQLDIMNADPADDDAAGIRKQLLQRFHCISCDRPVDMAPQGPIPSIPTPSGMPATRSARPYTTFELDQIRQQAKSYKKGRNLTQFEKAVSARQLARCRMHGCKGVLLNFCHMETEVHTHHVTTNTAGIRHTVANQPQLEVTDLYATSRACGGSHTLTYPHRRTTRTTHINNLFREEEEIVPSVAKDELDIQGADGHIYKGRMDTPHLPHIPQAQTQLGSLTQRAPASSPKMGRRVMTSPGGPRPPAQAQVTAQSPRPSSARLSRPSSAGLTARPQTAASTTRVLPPTEVPTGHSHDDDRVPPSPPAPTERDPQDAPSTTQSFSHLQDNIEIAVQD